MPRPTGRRVVKEPDPETTLPLDVQITPEQWVRQFLQSSDEARLRVARAALRNSTTASECFVRDHKQLEQDARLMRSRLDAVNRAMLQFNNRDQTALTLKEFLQRLDDAMSR